MPNGQRRMGGRGPRAYVDRLDATNAQFYADAELGAAQVAFDRVREAAQADRAAQQAQDHEQADEPSGTTYGTADPEPEADVEAGT